MTNGKMLVTGSETYHLPHLHKTTVSPLMGDSSARLTAMG